MRPVLSPRPISLAAVAAALLATTIVTVFASHATAANPVLRVSASPAALLPGEVVRIDYAVKPLPAKLVLRLDQGSLKTVRPRKPRGRATFTVPADTKPGPHRLAVCVRKTCRSLTLNVSRKGSATAAPQGSPSSSPGTEPEPVPQPPAPAIDFTGPANPLDVEAHTDASRRATATIDTEGGALETTGADGTHYRLIVPEGALLSPERISMTPIAAVDGMPFSGGLVAGVQLEPSGLRFSDYVTVEISGHPPVAPQQETGFLYQHDGVEFQLYPLEEEPSKTTFQIIHFSGVGVADGTEAERNAQLLRATQDVEGRFGQQIATYFRPDGIDIPGLEVTLRAYHDQVLQPLVTAALTDDSLALPAIQRLIPWNRMIELLFGSEFMLSERTAMQQQFEQIMRNAAIKAHARCVDQNRPEELPMMLYWWHYFSLLSDEQPVDVWEAIKSCVRFELDFHTKVVQKHPGNVEGPEVWTGEAIAENVILEPNAISLEASGSKEAEYVDFRIEAQPHKPGTGCWKGGGEWETAFPFTVSRLRINLNPVQRPDGSYGYPKLERGKIAVSVVPFLVHEYQYFADCGGATGAGGWGAWLAPTFLELHEDQFVEDGGMVFTDWTVPDGGGSMLGSKAYFRTVMLGGEETREETTLELYHAPTR